MTPPRCLSGELKVSVMFGQNCSRPFAIGAGAVGVDHAADRDEIAGLVLGDGRTDLGYTADDLMAGDIG